MVIWLANNHLLPQTVDNNNNIGHDYFIEKLPYVRLSLSLINLRVVQNVEDKIS